MPAHIYKIVLTVYNHMQFLCQRKNLDIYRFRNPKIEKLNKKWTVFIFAAQYGAICFWLEAAICGLSIGGKF